MKANEGSTRKVSGNQPVKGQTKFELGRKWIHTGDCWQLAEIQRNVIDKKNAGTGRLYSDKLQSIK